MLLAYVDESGNTGDPNGGGSLTYSLGCVLVDTDDWPNALDQMIQFRRRLRTRYGIPVRSELKANYLIRGAGPLRPLSLSPSERSVIFRAHLRMLDTLRARAFAIVVDKRSSYTNPDAVFDSAWSVLLQRLNKTSEDESAGFMVIHDEGEDDAIRKWARRVRRHLTSGSAINPGQVIVTKAARLIDDPVPRRSHDTFMIQVADLVAYAGFRDVVKPGGPISIVCPSKMWQEIGVATHTAVNKFRPRASPGVVIAPMRK